MNESVEKRIINVKVNGHRMTKDSRVAGVQYEGNATTMRFEFDESWADYAVTVTFFDAKGENATKCLCDLKIDDNPENNNIVECKIPFAAMQEAGELTFVVEGIILDESDASPKVAAVQRAVSGTLEVLPSMKNDAANEDSLNDATVAQQIEAKMDELEKSVSVNVEQIKKDKEATEAAKKEAENSSAIATDALLETISYTVGGTGIAGRETEDEDNAMYYASKAGASASSAEESKQLAKSYAVGNTDTRPGEDTDNAKFYCEGAGESASDANDSALLAKSYAIGGTGTRPDEDIDNAQYYATAAKDIVGAEEIVLTAAEEWAGQADESKTAAEKAKEEAEEAATIAKEARTAAVKAKEKVESMTVSAETVAPDSDATVEKAITADTINLHFSIPHGASGVYVGSGEMPEGYNVQIDPNGTDTRFGLANAVRKTVVGTELTVTDSSALPDMMSVHVGGKNLLNLPGMVNDVLTETENGYYRITMVSESRRFAQWVPLLVDVGTTVTVFAGRVGELGASVFSLQFMFSDGTTYTVASLESGNLEKTFTPEKSIVQVRFFLPKETEIGSWVDVANAQLELGRQPTEYEAPVQGISLNCNGTEYTPNENGDVLGLCSDGQEINMSVPSGYTITMEYSQDTAAAIREAATAYPSTEGVEY